MDVLLPILHTDKFAVLSVKHETDDITSYVIAVELVVCYLMGSVDSDHSLAGHPALWARCDWVFERLYAHYSSNMVLWTT